MYIYYDAGYFNIGFVSVISVQVCFFLYIYFGIGIVEVGIHCANKTTLKYGL